MNTRGPESRSRRSFNNLPQEILLAVIARVEYAPRNLSAVYRTNRLLHDLMTTHRTSLIKEIAQHQFPLESVCAKSARPSRTWLCDLAAHRSWINDLLEASKGFGFGESLGLELANDEQYNQWASVGMHLSVYVRNRYYSTENDDFHTRVAILRSGIATLPTTVLLHLHVASILLAETVTRHTSLGPLDRMRYAPEIRTAIQFLLCASDCTAFWYIVVEKENLSSNHASSLFRQAKGVSNELFMKASTLVILGKVHKDAMDINLDLQTEIERRLGHEDALSNGQLNINLKKLNAKELDLAVIRALRKETLSDKTVAQMLAVMR